MLEEFWDTARVIVASELVLYLQEHDPSYREIEEKKNEIEKDLEEKLCQTLLADIKRFVDYVEILNFKIIELLIEEKRKQIEERK